MQRLKRYIGSVLPRIIMYAARSQALVSTTLILERHRSLSLWALLLLESESPLEPSNSIGHGRESWWSTRVNESAPSICHSGRGIHPFGWCDVEWQFVSWSHRLLPRTGYHQWWVISTRRNNAHVLDAAALCRWWHSSMRQCHSYCWRCYTVQIVQSRYIWIWLVSHPPEL